MELLNIRHLRRLQLVAPGCAHADPAASVIGFHG
jgi:hypothetical protein